MPDWAEWIAQDEDGEYWAYEDEPTTCRYVWLSNKKKRIIGYYPILIDWTQTKERRPTASID